MAAEGDNQTVINKQVVLKDYVRGVLKETDMSMTSGTMKLKVSEGSNGVVLVKILYLSCDPYMRNMMAKLQPSNGLLTSYTPHSPIYGFVVAKVVDSDHPEFDKGDFVWGTVGWEEYSLITKPADTLFKIRHTY